MPTYSWTRNREELRDMVLRKLGVLGAADVASAEDGALVLEAMNARLKEMHALSLLWWDIAAAQTDVTLTGGVATATVAAADYLFPVTVAFRVGTEDRELQIIGHREYQAIPDKTQTGDPSVVFASGSTLRFHPVPQANGVAKLTYQAIGADFATGEAVELPASLMRAFANVVAGDLIAEYGISGDRAGLLMAAQKEGMRVIRAVTAERSQPNPIEADYF